MKTSLAIFMLLLLQSCVENKSKKNESKLESFQMSGNMAGYSCNLVTNNKPRQKVFIDGISFEHGDDSMRFYLLDDKKNIVDTSVQVNGHDLWQAYFDTHAYREPNIDSEAIEFYSDEPGVIETKLVVRHWIKGNGLTQIISSKTVQKGSSQTEIQTLEAEIRDCRPAIINETEHKIVEI